MDSRTGIPPLSRSPVARTVGGLLGGGFALGRRLRHPRPIHSRGVVLGGEMRWIPDAAHAGLSFIDEAPMAPVPVVARVSRSLGLPAPLPDIIGLALRFDAAPWGRSVDVNGPECGARLDPGANAHPAPADIELASTGWGVPARFGLIPHRRVERARFGTLLPYRGRRGPVLLGARTRSGRPAATDVRELPGADDIPWIVTLGHASAAGRWHPFAVLELRTDTDQDDSGLRFDAVRHPVPGARSYAWVRAARQPSYVRVQSAGQSLRMPARGAAGLLSDAVR